MEDTKWETFKFDFKLKGEINICNFHIIITHNYNKMGPIEKTRW